MNEFDFQQFSPEEPQRQIESQQKKKTRKISGVLFVAIALSAALLGGIAGSGLMLYLQDGRATLRTDTTHVLMGQREDVHMDPVETGELMTAAQVYAQNVNATVGITTAITTNYWGYQTTSAASGSGFILTSDGYILTNFHVIQESSAITVSLYDGSTYEATLIGHDSSNDIAVIKVDAEDLTPVVIGDEEKMFVGNTVVAIGNPLGELTFSLTQGVISAMDRKVTLSSGTTMELLQTDCSINSGNSGGALFNLYGEVIGITNAKYSNNGASSEASIENIGFAIPIGDVMPIVESIIEKGYVSKPYIGVSVTDVSLETQNYGLPQGAAIKEIAQDSPAQNAGLQINDIIVAVNEQTISGSQDLIDFVKAAAPGDLWSIQVYRQGANLTLTLEIGQQIQSALPNDSQANMP